MMRYRWDDKTGKFLVWSERSCKWVQDRKRSKGFDFSKPMNVMLDIKEFVAHATDKPVTISSRSQLARYERANNVRQCGDYKPGEIQERRRKKIEREAAEATKRAGVGMSGVTWSDFR